MTLKSMFVNGILKQSSYLCNFHHNKIFLMRFLILFVHFTALHFAIREKKIGIIQLLLTHPSIDINMEDSVY